MTTGQSWALTGLTVGSLITSICLVLVSFGRVKQGNGNITLSSRMGQGQWDFSQSYASNTTIVTSAFTLLFKSGAFPNGSKVLPPDAYSGLAIIFGILVVIAPLVYNGTATRVPVSAPDVDTADEYHGTVWGFLMASVMTDWGLIGSIATVFVALLDLYYTSSLPLAPLVLLSIVLVASLFFFISYTWVRIDGTLTDQFDPARIEARMERSAAIRANAVPRLDAPTEGKPPPSPRWTLL